MAPTEPAGTVVAQWHNRDESPEDFILVRRYANGDLTAERKAGGRYLGEHVLAPEPGQSIGGAA